MKQQNKQNQAHVDTVARDFRQAIVIASLATNVVVFVSWLTITVAAA